MGTKTKVAAGCLVTASATLLGGRSVDAGHVQSYPWLKYRAVPTYFSSIESDRVLDASSWGAGSQLSERTVMNFYLVGSHYNTNSVSVVDERYPDTWLGQWSCQTTYSSPPDPRIYCNHGHVRFNLRTLGSHRYDPDWKHVGCQEFGHASGLTHRSSGDTCMRDNTLSTTVLDRHDIDVVNFIH